MEHNVRVIEPELLMEQLPELLEKTQAVPLVISGNSMAPFLIHGRDTVYLSRVTRSLKRGDMILYRRDCGAYVLHRICRCRGNTYSLVGDGQYLIESGIRNRQVLAVVTAVRRKGKLLRPGSACWMFFQYVWLILRPVRPYITGVYERLRAGSRRK